MIILGIDPGSLKTGYAVILCPWKNPRTNFKLLDSGTFILTQKTKFPERLSKLNEFFYDYCKKWRDKPYDDENIIVSIESLAYVRNPNSFGKLAQARGAILAAVSRFAREIHEYPPNKIKATVAKHGLSGKGSVQKALRFYGVKNEFTTDDESDAIAAAICHWLHL